MFTISGKSQRSCISLPPKKPLPPWRIWFWSFLGALISICVIQILFLYAPAFREHNFPAIVGSFGASAVLAFGAIESPLAQPRPLFIGHAMASIIGVCISKLFLGIATFSSEAQAEAVRWVAGGTSMALTLIAMQITKTIHPPAGATALIAIIQDDIVAIGWLYIPIIILSAAIMLALALIINNIERRYPIFWWKPNELPPANAVSEKRVRPSLHDEEYGSSETVTENWQQESTESISGRHVFITPGRPISVFPPGFLKSDEEACLNNILARLESLESS